MKLLQIYKAWRERRYWQKRQLAHLRMLVQTDARWLAANPVAAALTQRYEAALADDWYTRSHEDVSALRVRLNLTPNYSKLPAPPPMADFGYASCVRCGGRSYVEVQRVSDAKPKKVCVKCGGLVE